MAITTDNSQDFWAKIQKERGQYQLTLNPTSSTLLSGLDNVTTTLESCVFSFTLKQGP